MSLPTSVSELLQPFRTDVIAKACDAKADTVRGWRSGENVPSVSAIAPIASFTRLSVEDVVRIITEDSKIGRTERMARAKSLRLEAVA